MSEEKGKIVFENGSENFMDNIYFNSHGIPKFINNPIPMPPVKPCKVDNESNKIVVKKINDNGDDNMVIYKEYGIKIITSNLDTNAEFKMFIPYKEIDKYRGD